MDKVSLENESDKSSELDLENFKQGVAFPFEKLQQIVYNDHKYSATIIGFIRQGLKKIKRDELQYALILFNEAQKILQYGASCGRIIDRNLIVCVLHNQACCYQKLNELNKAIKYVQAIIFNLKAHLKSIQVSPTASNIIESGLLKNVPQLNRVSLIKKIQLAHYQLQFCSVNSQMKIRKIALQHGKAGIQMFKGFFIQLRIQMNADIISSSSAIDKQKIRNSIKQFKLFRDEFNLEQLPQFIKLGKYYVKKWISGVKNTTKTVIDKVFKSYSIGNFVELQSLQYDEQDLKNKTNFTSQDIVRQLLHFSMGYFQIATEYRLVAEEKYKIDAHNKQNSEEFKLSNLYHILAIILIAINIPYNLIFMEQILSSYEHHYKQCLNESIKESDKPSSSLLFIPELKKRTLSRKRKLSELKSLSKKKKLTLGLSHRKQHSISKIKNTQSPNTAKQQYFAAGLEDKNLRTQRVNSNQSKNSQKNQRKRLSSIESKQINGLQNERRRQRMKTKFITQGDEKLLKKKQRAFEQYCAMPLTKDRKKSFQKISIGISKGSKRNSRINSSQKNDTFRKSSNEKSLSKHFNLNKEREKEKVTNHKNSTKKLKLIQNKEKKKQMGTIRNYYL